MLPLRTSPGMDDKKGVLCIPKRSSCTDASPSDCLVTYPGHSLEVSYPFAEMQSVYSTAPADWAHQDIPRGSLTLLQRCSRCNLQPLLTRPLMKLEIKERIKTIKIAASLILATVLSKVMEIQRDLLLLRLLWKITSLNSCENLTNENNSYNS